MSGIKIRANTIAAALPRIHERNLRAVETYGRAAGDKMVQYAKGHLRWENRTYNARNHIGSSVEHNGGRVRVNLTSGMEYGYYLEHKNFKNKGRLDIWWPTVREMTPEILRAWAQRLNR